MPHQRIIVLDTETTGVLPYDKLIALAAIRFDRGTYVDHVYRVYDPRKDSHPGAQAVHGWDDWLLRFQPLFAEEADEVRDWLDWADCLVMHNAVFDMHYVARELRKAERSPIEKRVFCTMQAAQGHWPGHSAKLSSCVSRLGLGSQAEQHDAFQDAFLTAQLYFHMKRAAVPSWMQPWPAPTNLLPAPPRPPSPLPRRSPKKVGWRAKPAAAPIPAPPAGGGLHRSVRGAVERARDGQKLIRFVAARAEVPRDVQWAAIDAYSAHVAGVLRQSFDEALRHALRESAMALTGSQNGATTASRRLAANRKEMSVVLPLLMGMIKRDGRLTEAEERAMRHIFEVIRAAGPAPGGDADGPGTTASASLHQDT
ncbi:exonuclease domain-containing protein [Xanthobacter sp. DSM 24535]|uniref:3'-5' exonuclease n=1 Tax=Roseixanthobacter psychrophilus TaxID=3119917 RepID=UPI0037272FB3